MSPLSTLARIDLGLSHIRWPVDGEVGTSKEDVASLNKSLDILATIFPDILPEVFREALLAFRDDSRLQVVVDQLLRNQDKWVRGRRRVPSNDHTSISNRKPSGVSPQEQFRHASYEWASYSALCLEFRSTNKSVIKAVLAEENHHYISARVKVAAIASKSWRSTISAFWARWRKAGEERKPDFLVIWPKGDGVTTQMTPILRDTGDAELDLELRQSVLQPLLAGLQREQEVQDLKIARALNEREAEAVNALYECQCCFFDVAFEDIAICTTGSHFICDTCTCRTSSEALFGQGWARNINHVRGLLRCPAPSGTDGCQGCISNYSTEKAICQSRGGIEMWKQYESRLIEESVSRTALPLVRCPFCPYAEAADQIYLPPNTTRQQLRLRILVLGPHFDVALPLLLSLILLPVFLLIYVLLYHVLPPLNGHPHQPNPRLPIRTLLKTSHARMFHVHNFPRRFHCQSLSCGAMSCTSCSKAWRDPHICHESAAISLRTAVESARTAALKRTCPRCGLAFVKDLGCNKLTCVCGYAMCYVCRQGLGKGEGGEGYRHFCQHFRPLGGACQECERCDLYRSIDEDELVLQAGVQAEKDWREREGMVGVEGIGTDDQPSARRTGLLPKDWSAQGLVDWWMAQLFVC